MKSLELFVDTQRDEFGDYTGRIVARIAGHYSDYVLYESDTKMALKEDAEWRVVFEFGSAVEARVDHDSVRY